MTLTATTTLDDAASIAREAAAAFHERDAIAADLACADARIRALTAAYGQAAKCWGFSPDHLRRACSARGLL